MDVIIRAALDGSMNATDAIHTLIRTTADVRAGVKVSADRFEELDGVAVRILDLDLPTKRAGLHIVAEAKACPPQFGDEPWQIGDSQDAYIGASLRPAVMRPSPLARSPGATRPQRKPRLPTARMTNAPPRSGFTVIRKTSPTRSAARRRTDCTMSGCLSSANSG